MEGKSNCQKVFFDNNDVNVCRLFKDLRDLQYITSFTVHDKKTSFVTGIPER